MNALVLMSGSSQSFIEAGYPYPKNLVEIAGKPMMQRVIDSLLPLTAINSRYVCVLRRDENRKFYTSKSLQLMYPDIKIVEIPSNTTGAACSALLAVDHIDNDQPLIICNGDQILQGVDLSGVVKDFQRQELDAGVVVFNDIHPRWSFVKCSKDGLVIEAAEKRPISKHATAGVYYYARGREFVRSAMEMIKKDAHVNGAFFICPALNEMILQQARIGIHPIDRNQYRSLATPADVVAYENFLSSSSPS
jgi:dTDP-glucose pyrophosphorylase